LVAIICSNQPGTDGLNLIEIFCYAMELVFKLPRGKPPFIGVLFPTEYSACHENQDLPERKPSVVCRILLEPIKTQMHLRLVCEELVTIRFYNYLHYDHEKLKNWLYLTKDRKEFTFGHIVRERDTDKPVKLYSTNKYFVLKIEKVEVIQEQR